MTCYHPIKAYRPLSKSDGGRLVFDATKALNPDVAIPIPCNKCIGCRLDRSRDTAVRAYHESTLYNRNCFLTLSYHDDHLPEDFSVDPQVHRLFFKRLRKHAGARKLRYLGCGEYGDKNDRPHYHYLVFNFDFTDKVFIKKTEQGHRIYKSEILEKLWPYGHAWIGDVTFDSAAYVGRYVMKKQSADNVEYYTRIHPLSNTAVVVKPEFQCQSTKPGLGRDWFDKFKDDAFPSDFVTVGGRKMPVPKYYLKLLQQKEETQPIPENLKYFQAQKFHLSSRVKRKRIASADRENTTPARLRVREIIKADKAKTLTRNL